MWRNWKDKVVNFFFKEIEDESEHTSDQYNPLYGTEKYRLPSLREDNEQKVRYQYPKGDYAPFRFPVIPDEKEQQRKRRNRSKSKDNNRIKSSFGTEPLIFKTNKTFNQNKLEDVPAFMRRKTDRIPEEKTEEQEQPQTTNESDKENSAETLFVQHSTPDELDKVFRKRDGKLENNEQETHSAAEKLPSEKKEVLRETGTLKSRRKLRRANRETVKPIHSAKQSIGSEQEIAAAKVPITTTFKQERQDYQAMEKHDTVQATEHSVPNYLLNDPDSSANGDDDWVIEQQILLEDTFNHFNINATVVNVTQGPAVTRFEIQPAMGVKVSKIRNLADDLKLNMAAKDIRIEAPIPGKNTIGIEVPNKTAQFVSLQEIIETEDFKSADSPLTIALGLTIEGLPLITNIEKMPHGLIAGATGSGKSVCINTIILSILYKAHHDEVKLLLVDPKMVELTPYNKIPHLIAPVITDVKAATKALKWAVDEMELRYQKFVELGVRNIQKYNEKISKPGHETMEKMPYIVIIIDELADLMMISPQEVEDSICRIAQKARACGIHLLLATQRPSVDVITGLIKANIPTRIAFSVSSQVDSRTMLDTNGAEKLLGKGDMLFVENGAGRTIRLQGPFVSDEEIERVASYVRSISEPEYLFEQEELLTLAVEEEEDDLLNEVIRFVVEQQQASTSLLQRQFRIGYNRAARLIDSIENKGIISGQNGSKPRDVLVSQDQVDHILK